MVWNDDIICFYICVTVFGEYGNALKDITRVMGQVYKTIMVSITRNTHNGRNQRNVRNLIMELELKN